MKPKVIMRCLMAAVAAASSQTGIVLDGDAAKPMPAVGFGTCCRPASKGPALINSTLVYLAEGGRLIDTAPVYNNQRDIAVALRESGISRADVWLTSKINYRTVRTRADALNNVRQTCEELGVDYVDLCVEINQCVGWRNSSYLERRRVDGVEDDAMIQHERAVIDFSTQVDLMLIHHQTDDAVEIWRGLLDAKAQGLCRHIGVSNFERPQIEALERATGARPALNEVEFHPFVDGAARTLVAWCLGHGVAVTAFNSLGGSKHEKASDDAVAAVAATYNTSPAAVLLRWALDQGVAVIPGATSADHIRENLHLPTFELTAADRERLTNSAKPLSFKTWHLLESDSNTMSKGARKAADIFTAAIRSFYENTVRPARSVFPRKPVRLDAYCAAAEEAARTLTLAQLLDVLGTVSVRDTPGTTFFDDHGLMWWLPHWFGVCEAARLDWRANATGALRAGARVDAVRAFWDRFNERFDCSGGALDTGRVRNGVSTYAPRRDDACVWIRRELAPSYVHGLVWGRILDRRRACPRRKCFLKARREICEGYDFGDLYGECYHGAMHAAFLWAVADAGEDVLGSVPVDGAFTGARAEQLRKASLEFEPELAHHEHSFRIYLDWRATPGLASVSHWRAFLFSHKKLRLRFASQFPPVSAPCAPDFLAAPDLNTSFVRDQSASARHRTSTHVHIRKGPWSVEEKQRFDDAYKKYRDDGLPDWSGRVAKAVGTRSKLQVRSRATNQNKKNRTVS